MLKSQEPDILNWIMSKMISFNLATTSKLSNALEGAAPYSYIHASTDIGEVVDWITDKFLVHNKGDLAVLYNRNKMVNAFTNTEWVSDSGGGHHLAQRHVLCWYDGFPRTTCSD